MYHRDGESELAAMKYRVLIRKYAWHEYNAIAIKNDSICTRKNCIIAEIKFKKHSRIQEYKKVSGEVEISRHEH